MVFVESQMYSVFLIRHNVDIESSFESFGQQFRIIILDGRNSHIVRLGGTFVWFEEATRSSGEQGRSAACSTSRGGHGLNYHIVLCFRKEFQHLVLERAAHHDPVWIEHRPA